MARKHVLLVALVLAVAAIFGVVALARTAHVGAAAHARTTVSSATIARRGRALDRLELSLRTALAKKPPALPAVPKAQRGSAATAPRVTYVRPAPIVVSRPSAAGGEHDHEGGSDDRGGGMDD
jgi:hypothetical protein